jgi:PKD repeat protein
VARLWKFSGGQWVPLDNGTVFPPIPPADRRPVARLTVAPTSGTVPLSVTLDASASTDDHGITGYTFNFGDGSPTVQQAGSTVSHVYSAAGTYSASVTVTDTIGQTSSATTPVSVTPIAPSGKVYWPGLSCSAHGINAGESVKEADTLTRTDQIASRVGVSGAAIRARLHWHWYHSGTPVWDVTKLSGVNWAMNNGFGGVAMNMKLGDLATWSTGGFDSLFKNTMLPGFATLAATGKRFILVFEHEPENNKWTQAQATQWSQGTARFMKITAEFGNANIIFSTCHIPSSSGTPRSWWNPRPTLNTLCGSTAAAQAVMDKSFCGLDPYPEINSGGSLDTLESRCRAAITEFKTFGYTRFMCPEVALYNWNGTTTVLTAAQQAKRLRDELWVWMKANGFEAFNYYDVADPATARTVSRTLDTPEEQTTFGQIALGTA